MKHTKVIRRSRTTTREVTEGVAEIRSALEDCRQAESLRKALPNNSMAQQRFANACEKLSIAVNGDKYNISLGMN